MGPLHGLRRCLEETRGDCSVNTRERFAATFEFGLVDRPLLFHEGEPEVDTPSENIIAIYEEGGIV